MSDISFPTTAEKIARFIGAEILGAVDREVVGLSSIESLENKSLVFLSDKKFLSRFDAANDVTLLTTKEIAKEAGNKTVLVVENPRLSFAKIAQTLNPQTPFKGVSAQASIHSSVELGKEVTVGPFAVICEGVKIGAGSVIYPHAYIGPNTMIGEFSEIFSHVSLVANVEIGNRVKVFANSVIGCEGFGFLESGGVHVAIPQIGKVVIEDDVRIGAGCTIDRSTIGETRVGRGTKLDDQVHIGHNCTVGKNCILCAQVALGGSSTLEDGVVLGGQVAIGDHVKVGKGAQLAGQSGISADVEGGERYFGSPAIPIREAFSIIRASRKLPEALKRIKKLEEQNKETP